MRYLCLLISICLLLTAIAAAGSFTADMDVDTYMDAENVSQSFSESDLLWVASQGGEPAKEVYLSIINHLGSQGIFDPEQIESATLTIEAVHVDRPGEIVAYFLHGETLDGVTWSDKDDYDDSVSSEPVDITEEKSYSIDVTDIIKGAIEACADGCPYSVVLVAKDNASVAFASSESSDGEKPTLKYVSAE